MTKKTPTPVKVTTAPNSGYTETLQFPLPGARINSNFGARKRPTKGASEDHKGVDIQAAQGTPVPASASGTVTFAGMRGGYGNVVEIKHDDDTSTLYAHLSQIGVKRGQAVVGGEIIAKSGGAKGVYGSGTSTGAHLHYEVIKNDRQVNPLATTVGINANNRSSSTPQQRIAQEEINRRLVLNYSQDEIIQKLISGEHFKDNAANDYDNLTYHWRFFITTDSEVVSADTTNGDLASFYNQLNTYEQVTIAESGVTTYSIDEVTMEAAVGTDFQTESTAFTAIEMKITEPNGVNFLDALRNAALKVGTRNYHKCFYYLELTFKGYDEGGEINLKPFDGVIPNGGHWLWSVKLTDIGVNLSAGGGSYNLKLTPLADSLLTGTYNLIPSTVHPSGATVGEFMDDLCTRLNTVWQNIKGDPGIVQYKVQFHPVADLLSADEVRAMSVTPNEQELNPVQGFSFTSKTNTATIAQGFTISRTLDALMTACEQAQKLAVDALLPTDQANAQLYRQSILWRVEPEIHTPNYDPLYNEYFQHITLHIYGFRNHAAVLAPQDTLTSAEAQKAIIADMAKRNFLPKKYEYLFTGTNSEVIDMDLDFNLAWQAQLPTIASNTQEQAAAQSRVDPNAAPRVNAIDQNQQRAISEAESTQKIASNQENKFNNANGLLIELENAQKANNPPTEAGRAAVEEARKKYLASRAELDAQSRISHERRAQLMSNRPPSIPANNYGRDFGEDLTMNRAQFDLGKERKNETFPITVQTYTPTTSDTVGLPGQFHNGKSTYGAVLNQVYGPMVKQFLTVSLTIKGDPFWIGAGSFEQSIIRRADVFDSKMPNYTQGSVCFLFKMRYPLGQDESGNVIINVNETVTGVYQVNKVTHKFVDGKFTQVLQAYRVPVVDVGTSLFNTLYVDPTKEKGDDNSEPGKK